MLRLFYLPVLVLTGIITPLSAAEQSSLAARQIAAQTYGRLPLRFEANLGQAGKPVRFLARGGNYGLFLTDNEAVLSLADSPDRRAVLRVRLAHANQAASPCGLDKLSTVTNYLTGSDPARWRRNIPNYAAVEYRDVYPGIDLRYRGNQQQLEYDFVLAPHADPNKIALTFQGARSLSTNRDGDLVVSVGTGHLIEKAPVIYQEIGGQKQLIAGSYVLRGGSDVGFRLGRYNHSEPLIIDPALVYSTYLGGSFADAAVSVAVDDAGSAYVTGSALSSDFPTTAGALQTTFGGGFFVSDAFVSKLSADGTKLIYSTYIGGRYEDEGRGIAVDSAKSVYLTGKTTSPDFPVTPGAFQTVLNSSSGNVFVTKLNDAGSALVYSTLLGGSGDDEGNAIGIDASGDAFITGSVSSTDFPVTPGAYQTSLSLSSSAAFVTKLNVDGSNLLYSTYLRGDNADQGYSIAVDTTGDAYVAGATQSPSFPTTPGAFQSVLKGASNAFVTKLNASGSALAFSTFLGGSIYEEAHGIAVDSSGDAYVTGTTQSSDFPTTAGAFQTTFRGVSDVFITKLNANGASLDYSSFLGGNSDQSGTGIAIDLSGDAYVTGNTSSVDFPITAGAYQINLNGGIYDDAFVSKLNSEGSALLYSTLVGGNDFDEGSGIALDSTGRTYLTGVTYSTNFPTTGTAYQIDLPGTYNAFVAKLDTTQIGPVIALAGSNPGPPKQVLVSAIDTQSGLSNIQVLRCANCNAVTDNFTPGTKDKVITTATKLDQTKSSSVQLQATDLNGNSTTFDPTDIAINTDGAPQLHRTLISALEHTAKITNGRPGVHTLLLRIHGKQIPILHLRNGETRTIDISHYLQPGRNLVTAISFGRPGCTSEVVFTQ